MSQPTSAHESAANDAARRAELGPPPGPVGGGAAIGMLTVAREYRRGLIHIVDRAALEDISCECYAVVRHNLDKVFPPPYALAD